MTNDEVFDVLRRMLKYWANQDDDGPSNAEATEAVVRAGALIEDLRVAAGECRVTIPAIGTDAARLLAGNALLRSALRRAEQSEIEASAENDEQRAQAADWKDEAVKANAALAVVIRERDELVGLNEHVAEVQEMLLHAGVGCGADGSVVVGIQRLLAQRDDARQALTAVEWSGSDVRLECPLCHGTKEKGHHVECLIAHARLP